MVWLAHLMPPNSRELSLKKKTDRFNSPHKIGKRPVSLISEVVKEIKAKTGLYIRRNLPFLDKVYWGQGGIWSRGYFVSMVGISESTISKYIEMQGKEDSGQALLEF